jgi:hypothetical protein
MGKTTDENSVIYVWNELTSATEECKFARQAVKNVYIIQACLYMSLLVVTWNETLPLFFFVKSPAAEATEAPQPLRLIVQPVMKMISFFFK